VVKRAAFAVPGGVIVIIDPTGGYAYDRRIIAELAPFGWHVETGRCWLRGFPWPSEASRAAARTRLLNVPNGWPIVIDGLALGALSDVASELARRNPLLALVCITRWRLEWGLSDSQADMLRRSERAALATVPRGGRDKSLRPPARMSHPTTMFPATPHHGGACTGNDEVARARAGAATRCLICCRSAPWCHARDSTCWSRRWQTLPACRGG